MPIPFTLFNQAVGSGTRSTVLNPLAWFMGITASLSIGAFYYVPTIWWLGAIFGGLSILGMIMFLFFYSYFAFNDRDALRSEKYSIQKLAIQKGFTGDDITGYIRTPENDIGLPLLPASAEEDKK